MARWTSYEDFLKSPEWYRIRDDKLRAAGWKCERCGSRKNLQVHHRQYGVWGDERLQDLEAVCRACHEGHHWHESKSDNLGHYFKLIAEALNRRPFDSLADVIDAVKERFARLKLKFDPNKLTSALSLMKDKRLPTIRPVVEKPWIPIQTNDDYVTKDEATAFLRMLHARVPIRGMSPEPAARMADRAVTPREDREPSIYD